MFLCHFLLPFSEQSERLEAAFYCGNATLHIALNVQRHHGIVQRHAQQPPSVFVGIGAAHTQSLVVWFDDCPSRHFRSLRLHVLKHFRSVGLEVGVGELYPYLLAFLGLF